MFWNVLAQAGVGCGQGIKNGLNSIQQIIEGLLRDTRFSRELIEAGPLAIELLEQFGFDIATPTHQIKELKD
jgi:hypothetical protein